jgi:predicted RNase H-like HicB family nuclease
MKYMVVVERGPESWGAYVPDLPGCAAAGETKDEVLELIRGAVEMHIEALKADGEAIPAPRSEIEYLDIPAA